MKIIAKIHTDYPEKFGVPRQSGLVSDGRGTVVFEPEYRNPDALRGLEEYSHIWLLWEFSLSVQTQWSPTVRPPRLGGNRRVGVFATRSPFRPNPIGLSCVKLDDISFTENYGAVLCVSGVDMVNMTPIYDIKPYIPYTDSRPEASGGFSDRVKAYRLRVQCPAEIEALIPRQHIQAVYKLLEQDPRPSYQNDPGRIYTMAYADFEICFKVSEGTATITDIKNIIL